MPHENCIRICSWSGPRNISTALMYSFAQRADTEVVDEPLYGHYLSRVEAAHPGVPEVLATMECDGETVVQQTILGPCEQPVCYLKQMTHHLIDLDWSFLRQTTNILLTRDPVDMLPSLAKEMTAPPQLRDTGFDVQITLLDTLLEWGQSPPVLDSRELLRNPEGVLRQLCAQIGLPFEPAMLRWPAGPKPEDGIWAKHWYASVHKSTGFQPYKPKSDPFPPSLEPLLAECQPYYERLYERAIKAE